MKMRCSCGARLTLDIDMRLPDRDAQALQFWERHADCREGALAQSKALQDIAATMHDIFVLIERYEK